MWLRTFVFTLLFSLILAQPAIAEELTAEKKADIQQLLEMTNTLALGKQMSKTIIENLTKTMKITRPDIPLEVLELLPGEVAAVFDEHLHLYLEQMIPVYHQYFSAAEIKQMMQFYSTDLGQKTIRVMPELMQDGMTVGQQWGQLLAPLIQQRIVNKLRQQGIKV